MERLIKEYNKMVDSYKDSETSKIWERSSYVQKDIDELEIDCIKYKSEFMELSKEYIPKDRIRKLLEEKEKLSNDLYYSPNYDEKKSIEVDKVDSQIDLLKQLLEEE